MILRATAWRLVAYAVVAAIGIVTMTVVVRSLGVAAAGIYFATLSLAWVSYSVSDLNLSSVALREASRTQHETASPALPEILGLRLVTWTVVWLVVSVGAWLLVDWFTVAGHVLVYAWLSLTIFTATQQVPLQSQLRQGLVSTLLVTQSAASLLTALVLSAAAGPPWAYLGIQVPGLMASAAVLAALRPDEGLVRPRLSVGPLGDLMRSHWVLGLATVCAVAANRLGPLITLAVAGTVQAGLYGTAFRYVDAVEAVAPLLLTVLLPVLTRRYEQGGTASARVLRRTLSGMIALGSVGGFLTALLGPDLLAWLTGPKYRGLDDVFLALGVFLTAAFILQPLNYTLLAARAYRPMLVSAATGAVVLVIGTWWFAGQHGAAGAAWATAAGFLSMTIVSAMGAARLGEPWKLWSVVLRGAACCTVMFAVSGVPGTVVVRAAAGLVVGCSLLVVSGVVDRSDLRVFVPMSRNRS